MITLLANVNNGGVHIPKCSQNMELNRQAFNIDFNLSKWAAFPAVDVLQPFAVRPRHCRSVGVLSSCDTSNRRCPLFHCAPKLAAKADAGK